MTGTYTYYYGYNCYGYGCLSQPPGAQLPDPNPLPDIEADYVPPTTYTSTQPFTAKCPAGTVQQAVIATLTQQGGGPPFVFGPTVDAGSSLPVISAQVSASANSPSPNVIASLQGSNDGVTFTLIGATNPFQAIAGQTQQLNITTPGSYRYFQISVAAKVGGGVQNTGTGIYTVSVFGPSTTNAGVTSTATATSLISQANADQLALAAATLAANTALAAIGCATQYTSTLSVTVFCGAGQYDGNNGQGSTASATATSFVSQDAADKAARAQATANANALLTCNNSNNQSPIAIPAPQFQAAGLGIGSPYPTVKVLSGFVNTQHITRVRVNLLGLIHQNQSDIVMLLTGPNGQKVLLMGDCGGNNVLTQTNITLDSASGTPLPQHTTMVAGNFAPTSYNAAFYSTPFPAPAPGLLPNYSADFTGIVGQTADTANGSWALWVQDVVSLDIGGLNNGWTLQIDAA